MEPKDLWWFPRSESDIKKKGCHFQMKEVKLWEGDQFYILAYTMYTACTFADQDWLKDYLRLDLLIPLMGILEMDFPRFGDQTTTSPFF